MVSLAGASVALVILIDLATGQGPPALNTYFGPPNTQNQYLQPPVMQPIGFMPPPRGEFDFKRPADKFENEKELDSYGGPGEKEKAKELEEKYSKEATKPGYEFDKGETTPAPGVFASFQNSMSDAWKSLTNLGRHSRSVRDVSGQDDEFAPRIKEAADKADKSHTVDECESNNS